jgi:hypothetical protein
LGVGSRDHQTLFASKNLSNVPATWAGLPGNNFFQNALYLKFLHVALIPGSNYDRATNL